MRGTEVEVRPLGTPVRKVLWDQGTWRAAGETGVMQAVGEHPLT